MDLDSFIAKWTAKERDLGIVSRGVVRFAGGALPRDGAPFLNFEDAERQPRLWERFGGESDWTDEDRARLSQYRVIGFEGAGNPVCLEEPSGSVWVLDHEDNFRSRQFMNSGVSRLAECLLAYMGESDAVRFDGAVRAIDAPALSEGAFWWHETQGLALDEA